jgi:hypothetical protein
VKGHVFRVQDLWCRVQSSEFRVQGSGVAGKGSACQGPPPSLARIPRQTTLRCRRPKVAQGPGCFCLGFRVLDIGSGAWDLWFKDSGSGLGFRVWDLG